MVKLSTNYIYSIKIVVFNVIDINVLQNPNFQIFGNLTWLNEQ